MLRGYRINSNYICALLFLPPAAAAIYESHSVSLLYYLIYYKNINIKNSKKKNAKNILAITTTLSQLQQNILHDPTL